MEHKSLFFSWDFIFRNLVLVVVVFGSLATHLAASPIENALATLCSPQPEKIPLITCQLPDLFKDGVPFHLTGPEGNREDSSQVERFPGLRSDRKPIRRVFGLRFYMGNPLIGEGYLPTDP